MGGRWHPWGGRSTRASATLVAVVIGAYGWLAEPELSIAQAREVVTTPEPSSVPSDELDVRLVPDLVLTLGMVGVGLLLDLSKVDLDDDLSCPEGFRSMQAAPSCDEATVNPLDRWTTGLDSATASTLSDVLLTAALSGPLLFAGADAAFSDRLNPAAERWGKDTLVIAQTYAATFLVTNVLKIAVRRLRPYNYNPAFAASRRAGDSRLSFPSGHTSMAFAGAATLSVLLDQRFPGRAWAIGAAVGGFAVASTVAVSRVLAGRHFPSDVLVGAAIGTTLGLLVPRFHRGPGSSDGLGGEAPIMLAFGGRF